MRSGEIEADLRKLNEFEKLAYIDELLEVKRNSPEKGTLDSVDLDFH